MRQRLLWLATLLIAMTCTATAQDNEQEKKQINKIKKSSLYIYAEATCTTAEEAREVAESMLYSNVNAWTASKKNMKGKTIVIADRKDLISFLAMPRGNMFRAFTYVKKSDILPTENPEVLPATPAVGPASVQKVWPEAVTTLASYTDYYKMAEKLKELKDQGKVTTYARYQKLTRPEDHFLVVYNRQGQVVAILSPGTSRTNVKTGEADDLKNYDNNNCGAIGFSVK
jgi:hypothetical protein